MRQVAGLGGPGEAAAEPTHGPGIVASRELAAVTAALVLARVLAGLLAPNLRKAGGHASVARSTSAAQLAVSASTRCLGTEVLYL